MREAAIVATARTAIGRAYRGAFNDTEAPVMSAHVVNAVLERSGVDPARVDDVYLGVGTQAGTQSYNLGRLTVHASRLPNSVGGFALDRKCSSGLNALALAARGIRCDEFDVAIAGGMESISLTLNKHAMTWRNRSQAVIAAAQAVIGPEQFLLLGFVRCEILERLQMFNRPSPRHAQPHRTQHHSPRFTVPDWPVLGLSQAIETRQSRPLAAW